MELLVTDLVFASVDDFIFSVVVGSVVVGFTLLIGGKCVFCVAFSVDLETVVVAVVECFGFAEVEAGVGDVVVG